MRALILPAITVLGGILLSGRTDLLATWASGIAEDEAARIAVGLGFLLAIGLPVLLSYKGRYFAAARDMMAWAMLAGALVVGYSYRSELSGLYYRIAGELLPPGAAQSADPTPGGERSVRIRRRGDGHFAVNAQLNGAAISLMVDTGASTVVLRQVDAKKAGVDVARLVYNVPVQTANGVTFAARVRLTSIMIGTIRVEQVEALVGRPGALRESLLGMTFLSRLRSYEFSGDFLTLRS